MKIPSLYGPMPLEPGTSRDARSDEGRNSNRTTAIKRKVGAHKGWGVPFALRYRRANIPDRASIPQHDRVAYPNPYARQQKKDRKPAWRISFIHRWVGWPTLLVSLMLVSGCANRQSNPPPNPLIPSSQSESAPSPMSPSAPIASSTPSAAPRPMYYDFPDIPVPVELKRMDKDSFVFQSGSLKAGLLSLSGTRIDLSSLINFFQIALPRENWKPKGGFHAGRTVLIFEKPDKTCIINLYERLFSTYVEIYVAPATDQPISGRLLPLSEPRFAGLPEPTPLPLPEGQIKTS